MIRFVLLAGRACGDLQIAAQLRFFDLHLDRAVNDVRERSRLARQMLYARLIALPDVVVQKRARVELGQKLNVFLGEVAVGQNGMNVAAQRRQIQVVKVVAQRVGIVVKERLRIEASPRFQHLAEAIEELGVVERTHARLLHNIVREH